MNKDTEKEILELELKKQKIEEKRLGWKLKKWNKANERVYNTISQEEILDLESEYEQIKLEIKILEAKLKEL